MARWHPQFSSGPEFLSSCWTNALQVRRYGCSRVSRDERTFSEPAERRLEGADEREASAAHARGETVAEKPGDYSPNIAWFDMTKTDGGPRAQEMLKGFEIVNRSIEAGEGSQLKALEAREDTPQLIDAPRQQLLENIGKVNDADFQQSMRANMELFEQRHKSGDLPPSEIAATYEQVNRLLSDNKPGDKESLNKEYLAQSIMEDVCHPMDTNQGTNNTCGPTALREWMLTHCPARAAKLAVDALGSSGSMDVGGQQVRLDTASLEPDENAINCIENPREHGQQLGERSYLGQVLDNVLMNGIVQNRNPDNLYTERAPGLEGSTQVLKDGKVIESNLPTDLELKSLAQTIVGDGQMIISGYDTKSPEDLWRMLQSNDKNSIVHVHTDNDIFGRTANQNAPVDGHFVSATKTKVDSEGNRLVHISNQWGNSESPGSEKHRDRWIPLTDLYRAVKGSTEK